HLDVPPGGPLRRRHPQGREARGAAGDAADGLRARHQSQDRCRAGPGSSTRLAGERQRGDPVMRRRWRLFPKYALLIVSVVGGMLIASGVIGVYFSWRET